MKTILVLLFLSISCAQKEAPEDDYVLIEFASKLEEDHQKLSSPPEPDKKDKI